MPVNAVVTVASRYGAGGSEIGRRVADRLGVEFLGRALPRSLAERARLPGAVAADVDENPRSRWDQLVDALARASPPTSASGQAERLDLEARALHDEVERFLAVASNDGGVVVGRAGAVVLRSVPGALHVFLGGSRDGRVERVMARDGVDRAHAARAVDANDRARRDYITRVYGIDPDDPTLYHLMVDAVSLGVEVCVELIVAAAASLTRESAVAGRHGC
jgi:cytidylate kinase